MAYTPQHVANYFLDQAEREGVALTPLKLLKLVYIAYGWHLALYDRKLFDEPIEAWKHGPVVPSLYHEFKHYGSQAIHERSAYFDLDTEEFLFPDIDPADEETRLILSNVWAAYSPFTGWALRNKTHRPGTPWHETYDEGVRGQVIPDELIAPHFKEKIREYLKAARTPAGI